MGNTKLIDSYRFGEIVIDGQLYTSDVIIFPDRVDSSWWRVEGHRLSIEDLQDIIEAHPETLIIGTGDGGIMTIPDDTRAYLKERGVKLIAERTSDACQTFNRLFSGVKVIAALHLTC